MNQSGENLVTRETPRQTHSLLHSVPRKRKISKITESVSSYWSKQEIKRVEKVIRRTRFFDLEYVYDIRTSLKDG